MNNPSQTQDQLTVLYTFFKIGSEITRESVSEILVNSTPLNWFDLQVIISELLENKLLEENENILNITGEGIGVIRPLQESIPLKTRVRIDNYIKRNQNSLFQNISSKCRIKEKDGKFWTTLELTERKEQIIKLELVLPDKTLAKYFTKKWKENSQDIYSEILKLFN